MPFEKGHKLSTGRPRGSKNKITDVSKADLQEIIFDLERFRNDFNSISPEKRMDICMRAMPYFYSRPTLEMSIDNKPWLDIEFIENEGEEIPDEKKKEIYFKYGGDGTNISRYATFLRLRII